MIQCRVATLTIVGAFGAAILVKRGGHNFVIKEVMLEGLSAKEKLEAQNEAKLLRQLDHVYIVHYVDSGVQHGKLWIAMEFCAGGDLEEYITAKRKTSQLFSESEALGVFAQVALALNYIHGRHILHRDLKSKNIFLSAPAVAGTAPIVKLGDFGIAKVLANTRDKAKTQIGTPYYLSPEICEDKPYGTKSDVRSHAISAHMHAGLGDGLHSVRASCAEGPVHGQGPSQSCSPHYE